MQNLSFGERYPVPPAGTYLERTFSTKGDINLVRIHERGQGRTNTYACVQEGGNVERELFYHTLYDVVA